MQRVSSVTYSIKNNGIPRGNIVPSRGICRGDPLLHYLFLLCAEGLSSLIKSLVASRGTGGNCGLSQWPKIISHFLCR